jgi:hypothetical protein
VRNSEPPVISRCGSNGGTGPLEVGDALADGGDRARAFSAYGERRVLPVRADSFPLVDIHEVDPGRRYLDHELARTSGGSRAFRNGEHLGAAQPVHHDSAHHITSSPIRAITVITPGPALPRPKANVFALRPERILSS